MDSPPTTSGTGLIPWALRSHRTGTLVCGLLLFLLALITGPAWVAEARALGISLQQLAAEGQRAATSVRFLTGPADRLDTVGGYLSYKLYGSAILLLSVYAAVQGARIIRGSEGGGLLDLWISVGRTRGQVMRDRVIAFVICLWSAVALLYLGSVAGGALSKTWLVIPAIGQCVAGGLVALTVFGVSLLLSQFVQTARAAAAAAAGYAVAAYLVANLSGSLGAMAWLQYLSPFHYYLLARTLVPGIDVSPTALAALVVAPALLVSTSAALFLRRDVDGVSILHRRAPRAIEDTFRASVLVRRSLWLNALTEQPLGLVSWFVGVAAFSGLETSLVPAAMTVYHAAGPGFRRAVDGSGGAVTTPQYISLLLSFNAVLVAVFAVSQVARWAGDASQHRLDAVLCQPMSARRLIAERLLALAVMAAAMAAAVVAGMWCGSLSAHLSLSGAGLARAFADLVLLAVAVGGIGLLLCALLRSPLATAVTGGVLLASFVLETLAALLAWPHWTFAPSLFSAFGDPYQVFPGIASAAYLMVLAVVGAIAAVATMRGLDRIAA